MPNISSDLEKIIKNIPKAELHLHLTGSYPLAYVRKCAIESNMLDVYNDFASGLEILAKGVPYHDAFKYFAPVEKIVNTYAKVEQGVVALAHELLADGVVYAEIRAGLKDLGKGYEEYLLAILRGIRRCPSEITIKLLLSIRRFTEAAIADATVDLAIKYKDYGIVGLDISGDSTLGQIELIIPAVRRGQAAGLKLALHLGESPKEIDTEEKQIAQAKILEMLKPNRIGHGVFLSQPALDWMLAHRVPLEVCPTSSELAGMVDHHRDHPGLEYLLQHNHPIVIGADDLLLFRSPLSKEIIKLMRLEKFGGEQLLQLIAWSFEFAFGKIAPEDKLNDVSLPKSKL